MSFLPSNGKGNHQCPQKNHAGTSGWALCGNELMRLHVCANVPCTARYPAIKYGNVPPSLHVRLIETAPVAATETVALPKPREAKEHSPEEVERILQAAPGGSIPAPTASESPAPVPDSLGPKVCPPVAVTATAAASPEPSPATAPQAPAVAGPGAESKPAEETAASKIAEKSQVAPPPPPAPKSLGTLAEVIPPPPGGPHCYQCPALRLVPHSRVCLRSKWSNHPRWRG